MNNLKSGPGGYTPGQAAIITGLLIITGLAGTLFINIFLFPWYIHTDFILHPDATRPPDKASLFLYIPASLSLLGLISCLALSYPGARIINAFRDYRSNFIDPDQKPTFYTFFFLAASTLIITAAYQIFIFQPWFYVPFYIDPVLSEIGLLESATGLFFVSSSVIITITAINLLKNKTHFTGRYIVVCLYFGIAAALLFVGLEEMSYFQFIIQYKTPSIILEHNTQGELNLHNLVKYKYYKPFYLAASLFMLFVASASTLLRDFGLRSRSMILIFPHPAFLVPLLFIFALNLATYNLDYIFPKENELQELLAGFTMLVYGLLNFSLVRSLDLNVSDNMTSSRPGLVRPEKGK